MKPKQFFFVLVGIGFLVVCAVGGGYYLAMNMLNSNANNLATQLGQQTALANQISSLDRLQYQYNHVIVPILPMIDEALPRQKKQTEILQQLQNIASSVGLQITSISMPAPTGLPTSVSQTIKAGTILALPISFQLSGSYTQLQTFTADVENLNRFTDITNLAVAHSDPSTPIVYSISLNAYIKP